jgi:hypothetical protein
MPLPIQNPDVATQVHTQFNTVGRFRAQIDEVVVPVFVVGEATIPPEARTAVSSFNQAGVAAQRSTARLELPTGVIGRVTQIFTQDVSAVRILSVFFGSSIVAPANTAPKAYTDGRRRARGEAPAGVLTFGTQVAALAVIHARLTVPQNPGVLMDVDWVFGRTNAFDFIEFQTPTVNEPLAMSITWTEFFPTS